ncbi:sodium:calcium antiporter [Candidatus Woesearchaeota archaeon]|nr:sodium:calcium antiporter [Candidatus Woesearchaeota archaeon]
MTLLVNLGVIVVSSVIVYFASERFAGTSSRLGDYLHLPRSVKGATFDAVSSSLPELLIALFSVIFFQKFEVGIGTIAGSAMFNLLIIPGICVLIAPVAFKVSADIISRDGLFYTMSVFALLAALLYTKSWGIGIPLIFLFMYGWYIKHMYTHTVKYQNNKKPDASVKKISLVSEIGLAFVMLLIIGFATYFLTDHAIQLADALGVAPIIIAFTVVAAATSVPDAVISFVNARNGNIDDAVSNVFGSNIFNVFVGLSIPILLYVFLTGEKVLIAFSNMEIILGLLGSTIIVLLYLAEDHMIDRKEAWYMLGMYALFVVYIVYLSFNPIVLIG